MCWDEGSNALDVARCTGVGDERCSCNVLDVAGCTGFATRAVTS